jgi:hypothetical protein
MRKRMKLGHPSHATVVAYLALFVALGGGAVAASHLGKNAVGAKQLKKNAITTAKIKKNAITTAKIKNGAITSPKIANGAITGAQVMNGSLTGANVQDGSLSGTDINQSSLTGVRASNVYGVALEGNCAAAAPFPSGVSASQVGTGCAVTFPFSVINCAATATSGFRTSLLIIAEQRTVETFRNPNKPNELRTFPYGNGTEKREPVDVTLVC